MGGIKIWHIVVLIIAFVVLFGWKNLPSAARSLGESMRVFKSEVDQMKDENAARKDRDGAAPPLTEGEDRYHDDRDRYDRDDRDSYRERDEDRYRDSAQDEYRRIQDQRGDADPRA